MYLLRKGAYRDFFTYHLKAHTISNKLVSKVSAQKKEVMTATNMCSNFGGFRCSLPLKKADAEGIYLALVKCIKDKNLEVGNIVGMGFDGAATISGKKTGVQARLKKHAPHAVFVHCHLQQLVCVQAANSTTRIKYVYTMLTTLWKYFHYSPESAESLKEIQHVLNLPEMKVIKPSDTRWLAHEWCVKAVKASYTALVVILDINYQNFHAPEALGLYKALSKFTTIAVIIYWITLYY